MRRTSGNHKAEVLSPHDHSTHPLFTTTCINPLTETQQFARQKVSTRTKWPFSNAVANVTAGIKAQSSSKAHRPISHLSKIFGRAELAQNHVEKDGDCRLSDHCNTREKAPNYCRHMDPVYHIHVANDCRSKSAKFTLSGLFQPHRLEMLTLDTV